jgi:hypothetical protein
VDNIVKKTVIADYVPSEPMYVILSNGVSSRFGPSGAPDEATVFPNHFEIDYVRIWQASKPVAVAEPPPKPKPVETPSIVAILPSAPLP